MEEGTTAFGRSSPVVFAYQLSELWCHDGGENIVLKDHIKGATFETGEGEAVELKTKISDGIGGSMVEGKQTVAVFDEHGEENCVCVLPTTPP